MRATRVVGRLSTGAAASHSLLNIMQPTTLVQTLNEYIQDTEDLVNLKLDQHRNQVGAGATKGQHITRWWLALPPPYRM
jgi:hypothetical protein